MDPAGLPCHRSEIRSCSFLRKTETVWVCVNSRDSNNLAIREPRLIAFEPMPIAHDLRTICGSPGPYQTLCFIQLDWSAHHGKKTREGNKLKTAFRTCNGRLEYQTMRLPATFQAYSYTKGPGQPHGGVASIKKKTDFWKLA